MSLGGDAGDGAAAIAVLRHGAGVVERAAVGRLRLSGTARARYLHRVSAQSVQDLAPPRGAAVALLERTGKIVDVGSVHAFPDHLLYLSAAGRGAAARACLARTVFREDVRIEDAAEASALSLLLGPRAGEAALALAGGVAADLAPHAWAPVDGAPGCFLLRAKPFGAPAYLLLGPAAAAEDLRRRALAAGAAPVGEAAFEAFRILAGVPEGEREIDADANPLELGLDDALSLAKGCFTGQEAIAKMITYKGVRRQLAGLDLPAGAPPPRGTPLRLAGEEVGRLTSAAVVPGTARTVGLALLRREASAPGTHLALGADAGEAIVTTLPFPEGT